MSLCISCTDCTTTNRLPSALLIAAPTRSLMSFRTDSTVCVPPAVFTPRESCGEYFLLNSSCACSNAAISVSCRRRSVSGMVPSSSISRKVAMSARDSNSLSRAVASVRSFDSTVVSPAGRSGSTGCTGAGAAVAAGAGAFFAAAFFLPRLAGTGAKAAVAGVTAGGACSGTTAAGCSGTVCGARASVVSTGSATACTGASCVTGAVCSTGGSNRAASSSIEGILAPDTARYRDCNGPSGLFTYCAVEPALVRV